MKCLSEKSRDKRKHTITKYQNVLSLIEKEYFDKSWV